MSKNIFLCLLFVNIVFCYDYLDPNPNDRSRMGHGKTDEMDDSEVANIDVAGLFQSSDDDGLNHRFEADDSRDYLSNSDIDSLVEANLEEYQGNEDYSNQDTHDDSIFDENPQIYRNDRLLATNEKEIERHDNFHTQNNYKNLQKKCVFKNMKIPFFSHDKRKTTQLKKNKKRKLFNFASKKLKGKTSKVSTPLSLTTQRSTESTLFKLIKRSYLERVCPICRRTFIARRVKSNEQANNIIHNSRQFYNRNPNNHVYQGNYNKISNGEDAGPEPTMRDSTLSRELDPERR